MKTKNISIEIKRDKNVPFKETYIVLYNSKKKLKIGQKFLDESKNQSITLNFQESRRLMNLLYHYMFGDNFIHESDRMLKFEEK